MKRLVFFFIFVLLASTVIAYPRITPYVNDFLGVLSPGEEQLLESRGRGIEETTSVEIVIVTVATTDGEDRILYANRIGEERGVGKEARDNGIIILWSDEDERGGAIATGRGIESVLNDAKVARIGRASRPYFDKGEYYKAFDTILSELSAEIGATDELPVAEARPPTNQIPMRIIIRLIFLIVILVMLNSSRGGRFASTSYIGFSIGRSLGGGGFRGGGFGGGSFGGGGGKF